MLKIRKLYTEPQIIDPIIFYDGINLILGEKNDSSNKTNGVGKSLCIEFINYALLKKKSDSRLSLIPASVFPEDTDVCLDIEINERKYTLKRSISNSENPVIKTNEEQITFSKIEDATEYLAQKCKIGRKIDTPPSFRKSIGPLIRDENSEFKSITSPYDTSKNIADDYSPHLYLLGLSVSIYEKIKVISKEIKKVVDELKQIEKNVYLLKQVKVSEARVELNELDSEIDYISQSIDTLENTKGYELIKGEIISLEEEIEELRNKKGLILQNISKLHIIDRKVDIDTQELSEYYNQLKEGLGDFISKDLFEVIQFKSKIDQFQNKLISEKRNNLESDLDELNILLTELDKQYKDKIRILDQEGALKNLKQTYSVFQKKTDEASQLRVFVDKYHDLEKEKQTKKSNKEIELLRLQADISDNEENLKLFEKEILSIHDFIQGNRRASFEVKKTSKNQIIEFIYRIDDDGSHSVNRLGVFIYDIALLISEVTRDRHLGFLIHDNIFDVDRDTLLRSLKFIHGNNIIQKNQYILTLNSDKLEGFLDTEINEIVQMYTRASFTKDINGRFLKQKYQEKK
ncbi:DUF2326 domain-containing protein [Cyclobacterium sp. SYSU L10401]|uniref:DUF2326 domain-containing protein n=1 Tax=Cyclobacterium sp. SYSU L10401 TaxID=2678657 RepID=UPI0013D28F58|nr:DUF2326 domain-containing protein [Cyclobacterium sp. SYSU L10401]